MIDRRAFIAALALPLVGLLPKRDPTISIRRLSRGEVITGQMVASIDVGCTDWTVIAIYEQTNDGFKCVRTICKREDIAILNRYLPPH